MATLSSAWVFYALVVVSIYGISSKAGDIFNARAINNVALQAQTFTVSQYLQDVNAKTKRLVDKIFLFQLRGFFFVPSLLRTLLVSLLIFLVIGLAADLALYLAFPGELSPTGGLGRLEGIRTQPLFWSVTLAIVLVTNFISDFISFTKTRTVLQFVSRQKSVFKILLYYAMDFGLSCLIPILLTALVIRAAEGVLYYIYNAQTNGLGAVFIRAIVYRGAFSVAIFSLSTSLFIFLCGAIIGFLSYVVLLVNKGESLRNALVRYLNFENKPNIAIGVLAILIFSVFYWLTIICTVVSNSFFHWKLDLPITIFQNVLALLLALLGEYRAPVDPLEVIPDSVAQLLLHQWF